jgi:hypothetical protein
MSSQWWGAEMYYSEVPPLPTPVQQRLQQQCEKALEIIKPRLEEWAKCKIEIEGLVELIYYERTDEEQITEQPRPVLWRKLAAQLRKAEIAGAGLLDDPLLEMIKTERVRLEKILGRLQHGGPYRSPTKWITTIYSCRVLTEYRGRRPGLSIGKDWHQLAAVMFGYMETDAFNFDYLKLYAKVFPM